MKKLNDLASKSVATQILDHEAYGPKIQQIFKRVKEATISFFVRNHYVYLRLYYIFKLVVPQFEMAISIQQTASEIRDDTKVSICKSPGL